MSKSEQLFTCRGQSEEKSNSSWKLLASTSKNVSVASRTSEIHRHSTPHLTICPRTPDHRNQFPKFDRKQGQRRLDGSPHALRHDDGWIECIDVREVDRGKGRQRLIISSHDAVAYEAIFVLRSDCRRRSHNSLDGACIWIRLLEATRMQRNHKSPLC